jgi:hypothetical protein
VLQWGFRKESDVPDYFMCDVCEEIEYGTDYEDNINKGSGAVTGVDASWHPTELLTKALPASHSVAELEEYRRILELQSDSDSNDDGSDNDSDNAS